MKTVIFSGTTEGRRLSEMLSAEGFEHIVCVATDYGCEVMHDLEHVTVHVGRMDEQEMAGFLKDNCIGEGDTVVDATHPYASDVSANIKKAVQEAGSALIRVAREKGFDRRDGASEDSSYVNYYETMEEFAEHIDHCPGNILLTTGSKDLPKYSGAVSSATLDRTFVRVLSSEESIRACTSCGIEKSRIIAMQGPFSVGMNKAVLKQYSISHMLTKDSGSAGGFEEKLEAAADLGVSVHILARPDKDDNDGKISVTGAFEKITGHAYKPIRHLILAGVGTGSAALMTSEVAEAIRDADAVFGAGSVISAAFTAVYGTTSPEGKVRVPKRYDHYLAKDIIKVLSGEVNITRAVILFSGDSGFYSGAALCQKELAKWDPDARLEVLPGISSVSYLAARVGRSYDDARIVSIHGRNSLHNIYQLVDTIRHNCKTFALVSNDEDVRSIAKMLLEHDLNPGIIIGRNLSSEDEGDMREEIREISVNDALEYTGPGRITVLFINDFPDKSRIAPRIWDKDMIRGKTPMTKEVVRHESIARLELCAGDRVYDIGGGTGSIACEIASYDPAIEVITIERDKDACELIRKNIRKHHLGNVTLIEDDAVHALNGLPAPDCAFIGGSGGKLTEIVKSLTGDGKSVRIVINAVTSKTADLVPKLMDEIGAKSKRAVKLTVTDLQPDGSDTGAAANNPITIFSFTT